MSWSGIVAFLDAIVFCVKLALNGVEFVRALGFGDKINPGVATIQALLTHPVGIRPDLVVQVFITGFVA
jgi:hypothetical protein